MNVNWTKSISRIFAFVAFAVLIVSCDPIGVKKNSELSLTLNPESAGKDAGKVSVVVRHPEHGALSLISVETRPGQSSATASAPATRAISNSVTTQTRPEPHAASMS